MLLNVHVALQLPCNCHLSLHAYKNVSLHNDLQAVALALSCLSYDFIGTCLDESSEDLGTIQVCGICASRPWIPGMAASLDRCLIALPLLLWQMCACI